MTKCANIVTDASNGGNFVGKSHTKGGIKVKNKSTGQIVEVEGGEVIINKHASKKHYKELSKINQSAGGGVPIQDPDKVKFSKGGIMTKNDAVQEAKNMGIDLSKDFHEINNTDVTNNLIKLAKKKRYYKPKGASGSRARYFFYYLQRHDNKMACGGNTEYNSGGNIEDVSGWDDQELADYLGIELDDVKYDRILAEEDAQELMKMSNEGYYKSGGNTGSEGYKLEKIVTHYQDGRDWYLDKYPTWDNSVSTSEDWLDKEPLSVEEAKDVAIEILEATGNYDVIDEVSQAKTIQEIDYALMDTKDYRQDNTYNYSWWGGVINFGYLPEDGDGWSRAIVIIRQHAGGDPRGNYYDYEAYELDTFFEDFPVFNSNLTYQITSPDGKTSVFDTQDMEGYTLEVREDEIFDMEEGDTITLDDLEEKFGVDAYKHGGNLKKYKGVTFEKTNDGSFEVFKDKLQGVPSLIAKSETEVQNHIEKYIKQTGGNTKKSGDGFFDTFNF
jgi:hypothetical protein